MCAPDLAVNRGTPQLHERIEMTETPAPAPDPLAEMIRAVVREELDALVRDGFAGKVLNIVETAQRRRLIR